MFSFLYFVFEDVYDDFHFVEGVSVRGVDVLWRVGNLKFHFRWLDVFDIVELEGDIRFHSGNIVGRCTLDIGGQRKIAGWDKGDEWMEIDNLVEVGLGMWVDILLVEDNNKIPVKGVDRGMLEVDTAGILEGVEHRVEALLEDMDRDIVDMDVGVGRVLVGPD
jgi:hypothetical protein